MELIEKKLEKVDKVEKSVNAVIEMLKKSPINMQFVEEEIIIDAKYVDTGAEKFMLVDSGAPLMIVSSKWFEEYLMDTKLDEEDLEKWVVREDSG